MTFRSPGSGRGFGLRRRSRWLLPLIAVVVFVLVFFGTFTTVWTDVLWYRSIDYLSVYSTTLRTQASLFVVGGLIMAAVVAANIVIAYRVRPPYRMLSPEQQSLERYRTALEPHQRKVLIAICVAVGLITGFSLSSQWGTWLMFANGQPFGTEDPQFNLDVSFFVFTYPFLRLVQGFAFAAVLVSIAVAAITHYLYAGLRIQSPDERVTPAARVHVSVLLGIFVLLKAWAYWLDRFGLVYSERGVVTGASYTDINAVLPAKVMLTGIAVICAGLFFANIFRRGVMLPAVAFGLLVLSAVIAGGIIPAAVQQFQVRPNEIDKEQPYIARNIHATRVAYDIDDVKVNPYDAATDVENIKLSEEDVQNIPGIRLLDPGVVSQTFKQLQQIRSFYGFSDALDIDRYTIDGQLEPTVVAVRELQGAPPGQRGWVNTRLGFTHGFGFVAAQADSVDSRGAPNFVASDIPPKGDLAKFEPRIYFGESSPSYSIVGAPRGAPPREFDFPNESASGQENNTYRGNGGVPMGSPFNRLLYALKFQDRNIILSGAINEESRILYVRDPRDRVQRAAPFLELDGDSYPAVINGRIKWIVDAYTTTSAYPYSETTRLEEATRDTNTVSRSAITPQPGARVNYIRNSVKATVDAYSGEVELYQWDKRDPLLRTWMGAFPGVVKPRSAIGPELMKHLRYPEDLFKVQRDLLARYHVTRPRAFYAGQDFWKVPSDPTTEARHPQPPYYLELQMPGEKEPRFSLTSVLVPTERPNLAAFMAVNSKPGRNYGDLEVLALPRDTGVEGPGQAQNTFEAYAPATKELTLLRQGGAKIAYGNLLTLPVGDALMYIEPVYVQAAGGESYPLLQRVLVSFGDKIGYGPTLEDALAQVFEDVSAPVPTPPEEGEQPPPAAASPELQQALEDIEAAYDDGQRALKNGNWIAYGKAQQKLEEALQQAMQAQESAAEQQGSASGNQQSGS